MLELGAGFHGDLTGRENVYLNASILGLRRKQVDAVFDEIVAFSELEDFIDAPLRTYSSGMYLRLGFAVSVNLDPDILIIDEVLAVGDARFVARCFERIGALKRNGVTIIVVTHDLETAASLCTTAAYLERGELKSMGPAPTSSIGIEQTSRAVWPVPWVVGLAVRCSARVKSRSTRSGSTQIAAPPT